MSWYWIWFAALSFICGSIFSSLVTTANQEKKNSWNFLHYNSTFSRGYWCASKLKRYVALQRDYFIDYVSTVQRFSKLFAGRNSFDLVNMGTVSLLRVVVSHPYTGRLVHRYWEAAGVLTAEELWIQKLKFLLLLLNSVAKVSAEVAQSILAFL